MVSLKRRIKDRRRGGIEKITEERIGILFHLADESALKNDLKRADRYVERARKLGMKAKVRIPASFKRKFCKFCYSYLSGKNSRTRTTAENNRVVVSCQKCGRQMYFPYSKEVKERRKNGSYVVKN